MAKKKKSKKREKVCEIFEIEKDGKKVVKKTCGVLPEKHADKKEIEKHEKILRNFLIIMGFLVIALIAFLIVFKSSSKLEYEGVIFHAIQEGDGIYYNFKFPMVNQKGIVTANYNIYLRNDPRKIGKEIPFEGEFLLRKHVFVIAPEEFSCDGYGIIGIENIRILLEEIFQLNMVMTNDPEAKCDEGDTYTLIEVKRGKKNKIVQTGNSCYELYVKDCDILKVTERFMIEGIAWYFN